MISLAVVVQFVVGGSIVVLATHLADTLGPKLGAIVWAVPAMLYTSVIFLSVAGKHHTELAVSAASHDTPPPHTHTPFLTYTHI
jgi:hypothetical protein